MSCAGDPVLVLDSSLVSGALICGWSPEGDVSSLAAMSNVLIAVVASRGGVVFAPIVFTLGSQCPHQDFKSFVRVMYNI